MGTPRPQSFALQSLNNPSSTTLNTLASAASSTRPLQPHIHDIEADTFAPAQGRASRAAAFLKSDKAKRLAFIGAVGAGIVGGATYFAVQDVKQSIAAGRNGELARASKNQGQYCAQFADFSWVAPNFPGAKVAADFDIGADSLSGNFINFSNQPANMTDACMNLFGTQQVAHSPNATGIAELDVFGPFPGTSSWNFVDSEHLSTTPPAGVKLMWLNFVSDYNKDG